MKNIDKIRQMNSEELAKCITTLINCKNYTCNECPLSIYAICENLGGKESLQQWLEQEVEE